MYRSKKVRMPVEPPPWAKKKEPVVETAKKTPKRDEYYRPRTHKEFLNFLDEEDAAARRKFAEKKRKKKLRDAVRAAEEGY